MKKGILITCLSILLLSGCGSSGKGTKAIKECQETENYACVTKEKNDLLPSTIVHDNTKTMVVGQDIKTGSTIIFKNNEKNKEDVDIRISIQNIDDVWDYVVLFNEKDVEIPANGEFKYELPKEAIGKYININVDGGEVELEVI